MQTTKGLHKLNLSLCKPLNLGMGFDIDAYTEALVAIYECFCMVCDSTCGHTLNESFIGNDLVCVDCNVTLGYTDDSAVLIRIGIPLLGENVK